MKKYTRKKSGGKLPSISSIFLKKKPKPKAKKRPQYDDYGLSDREISNAIEGFGNAAGVVLGNQSATNSDMGEESGSAENPVISEEEEKKQDLRKKYLLGCARLKEKKLKSLNFLVQKTLKVTLSTLNITSFNAIKDYPDVEKYNDDKVKEVLSILYKDVREKDPMKLFPIKKDLQISSRGYIPDLIKHFTTYWILEYLLNESSDIETFKRYCNWASNNSKDINKLKDDIIEKYIQIYSNLSDDAKQVPEDISEKTWEEWPLKEPWVDFLKTKRITYEDFYYDNALKKQKGGRKRRYKTKRRFYKKKKRRYKTRRKR